MAGRIPRIEYEVVRAALDGALLGWRADDLADRAGWTRAHLSVRLRDCGLPSAGHLLLWARLLHAARWLEEPGRSAESVSRQLDYANGPAFRRALRNYVAATPTQVRRGGGIRWMLEQFLDVCGLGDSVGADLSVA
jgi:AraC-like DNA-binding protein